MFASDNRVFRHFLIAFMTVYLQQGTIKLRRGLVKVIESASKSKKKERENFGRNSFQRAMFSSSYEQPKSKQWFYRNFA